MKVVNEAIGRPQLVKKLIYRAALTILRLIGFGGNRHNYGMLLFKTDRIGDFVLATGLIDLLSQKRDPSKITLMVSTIVEPLARREFPRLTIIAVPSVTDNFRGGLFSGWISARRKNRGLRYREIVNLRYHPTLFEDLLLCSIRADRTIGSNRTVVGESDWLRRLRAFKADETVEYPEAALGEKVCLELEAHRRLGELVLGESVPLKSIMPRLLATSRVSENTFLFVPFSSQPVKDYPIDALAEAVGTAGLPVNVHLILCGEPFFAMQLEDLSSRLRGRGLNRIDVVIPKNLENFVKCVGDARCVFSMDSAAAHIATALDKSGVFILGGGHFPKFAPWQKSSRQQWIFKEIPCYGCDWKCNQSYVRCIHDISPSTVARALEKAWNESEELLAIREGCVAK